MIGLKEDMIYSDLEREEYYTKIRKECENRTVKCFSTPITVGLVNILSVFLRSFKYEIRGVENIPLDDSVICVCNHSNSHDIFLMQEILSKLKKKRTVFVAWDGLNILSRTLFALSDATFIKRDDKKTIEHGFLDFCSKVISGKIGVVFGEATWNLHPIKPMQGIKVGAVEMAMVTGKPIIPMIMEYLEVPEKVKKERKLYYKCVVTFGKPVVINRAESAISQAEHIQAIMENMRLKNWKEFGINKNSINEIDRDIYINHLYIKKFKALGFTYNSKHEEQFLLRKNGSYENEYHIDDNGRFVAGILQQ